MPPHERVKAKNLFMVSCAFAKDVKDVGIHLVIGGDVDNIACTSFGGSMRRFHKGLPMLTPEGAKVFHGGCWTNIADNPQQNNFLSTKESYGPTTIQICKICMLKQVHTHHFHPSLLAHSV